MLTQVAARRIARVIECRWPLPRETVDFLERAHRILIACATALAACRGDGGGSAALPVPGPGAPGRA